MKHVNVVLLSLIVFGISLLPGCTKTVYITKFVYPDFAQCVKPTKPKHQDYNVNDSLDIDGNFDKFMANNINDQAFQDSLEKTIGCYEDQVAKVMQKASEEASHE